MRMFKTLVAFLINVKDVFKWDYADDFKPSPRWFQKSIFPSDVQ